MLYKKWSWCQVNQAHAFTIYLRVLSVCGLIPNSDSIEKIVTPYVTVDAFKTYFLVSFLTLIIFLTIVDFIGFCGMQRNDAGVNINQTGSTLYTYNTGVDREAYKKAVAVSRHAFVI